MKKFYYSNWSKNNKITLKKALGEAVRFPLFFLKKIKQEKSFRKKLLKLAGFGAAAFLILGSVTFAAISFTLPDPNKLNSRVVPESTKIYARDGTTLLYEIHGETKRTLVTLNEIPDYVEDATIAIEDKNFYSNKGINIRGILRAVFKNFSSGDLTGQGGSTITQQFVKNAILTREKTLTRKIKEAVLAIEMEQRFTKDEILQLYLNEIPYGQNAYGIEAAAQTYFAKHANNLTLAEAAYLAALPQAPTFYSPTGPNRDRLENRKNLVLSQMFEQGYITEEQKNEAQAQKVTFSKIRDAILAPHFVQYVQTILAEKYGEKTLEEGGLRVVTTLDWKLQEIGEKAVKEGAARNVRNGAGNAALVAIDPKTGQILTMVGSKDYFNEEDDGQVNVAIRERQPGSSFKPYVYATAFKEGMSPATMLIDVRTNFGTFGGKEYSPANYDGRSHGIVNIRKAFAGSLNVPAVKTLALVGVQDAIDTAKDMGITSNLNADRCGLSLVLGGCEVKLLDHTSAMGVFANGGVRHEHTPILKITDPKGTVLEEYSDENGQEAIDPQVAYQIVNVMTDNDARTYVFGARSPLILPDRVVAAKTGTTNLWKDGWTMGFTPSLVAGVWAGNNDGKLMRAGADGVIVAAPIWNQFMREATKGTTPEQFLEPAGIQHILVDSISGKLPTEYTPSTKTEVFASFALPKDFDDVHIAVKINRLNGKLANENTPPELVTTRVYRALTSEMPNNPGWENPVRAFAAAAGYGRPPLEEDDGSVDPNLVKDVQIRFASPVGEQTITSLPFSVQLDVTGDGVESVELSLEGEYIGRRTSGPYVFNIDNAKKGWQTLTAKAILVTGESVENSIRINIEVE